MIKNVIFDVGNVLVRWSPPEIIWRCFQLAHDCDGNRQRVKEVFHNPIWKQLNLGKLTQAEAELAWQAQHGLTAEETRALFFHVTDHQVLIEGTDALAQRLKSAGYRLFALTDNVIEIVAYLKERHSFWQLFEGVVVSAEVGMLKPDPAIFRYTLEKFGLHAKETAFFDDYPPNVAGAASVGVEARLFTTAGKCEEDLREMALSF